MLHQGASVTVVVLCALCLSFHAGPANGADSRAGVYVGRINPDLPFVDFDGKQRRFGDAHAFWVDEISPQRIGDGTICLPLGGRAPKPLSEAANLPCNQV